jgi:hypothetical protein
MVERRDYQAFLRASANEKTSMRSVAALLPAPPPRATLWTQIGLLVVSGFLPVMLWLPGRLDAVDVVLLYLIEGLAYGLAVFARVLFTAAPASNADERPRVVTAIGYLLWHGVLWAALAWGTLALLAPGIERTIFEPWLRMLLSQLQLPSMWIPAALTAFFLAQDVVQRSDYIDAYLDFGPREVARYGYTYPFALIALLLTACALWFGVLNHGPDSTSRGVPLMSATFLALWLVCWRVGLKVLNLTLPIWGRGLAVFERRFERAMGKPEGEPRS